MPIGRHGAPRGIVQRSFPTADGRTLWLINWQAGPGPNPAPSQQALATGQAVTLDDGGQVVRLRS